MTLPRSKSRAIRVDGTPYRWMVSRVDREFSMLLRIEHADGQGQSLVVRQSDVYSTHRVPPVVPRYVAAAIRHARALGWRPEAPGEPSDKALGSFFAHLARQRKLPASSRPAIILEALCRTKEGLEGEAEHARPFYIPGGIEVVVEGRHVLWHGCCVTIDEWVGWRELLRTGERPWNGHDPFSTAALEGDRVVFHDSPHDVDPPVSVSRERYQELLDALEQDLRGFWRAAEAWVSARSSAAVGRALSEPLAISMGLDA